MFGLDSEIVTPGHEMIMLNFVVFEKLMWFRFEPTVKINFQNRECGSSSCAKDFESCCLSV